MVKKIKNKNWSSKHPVISTILIIIGVLLIIWGLSNLFSSNKLDIQTNNSNQNYAGNIENSQIECVPNWTCNSWSECSKERVQIRSCTDSNNCGINSNKPKTSQSCTYNYTLIEVIPSLTDFPTEYNREDIEDINKDDGNVKAYDTKQGFIEGKYFNLNKYNAGTYSVSDYFNIEIMFYEFSSESAAKTFKLNSDNYLESQGGYTKINLKTKGDCSNTKEDYGFSGGNIASSMCQEGNIVYWTTLSISNSFKGSEDYIPEFIKIVENKF